MVNPSEQQSDREMDVAFLMSVLASSGDCIKILDLDANLIFMTDAGQRIMEVSDFNAIRGCPWPDFWQDQGNIDAKAAIAAAKAGGIGHFQGYATTMKGTPRWWDVQVTPILGEDGRPARLLSVSRDITAQKAEEIRLRMAQEAGRIGTFEINIATDEIFPSRAFRKIFGLPESESLPSSVIEALTVSTDRSRQSSRASRADGSAPLDVEYRIRRANDGAFRWVARRAEFMFDAAGEAVRMFGTVQDVTDRKLVEERQAALVTLGDLLRIETNSRSAVMSAVSKTLSEALHVSRAGYAKQDWKSGKIVVEQDWQLPGVSSLNGSSEIVGLEASLSRLKKGDTLAIPNVLSADWLGEDVSRYDAVGIRAQILVPLMRAGTFLGAIFVHSSSTRTWTPDEVNFVHAVADRLHAVLAKIDAEAEQRLLNEELSHRLKNSFAMVMAIASQTLRRVTEQDAVATFNSRVMALSSAHDVLLHQGGGTADIRATAASVLALHGDTQRFKLDGPKVSLGPKAVLSISLLLHELATNANKYGALSVAGGVVDLSWRITADAPVRFIMRWQESGGPAVTTPSRKGVGSRLINLGIVGSGHAELSYDPSGFTAQFTAPMNVVLEQ